MPAVPSVARNGRLDEGVHQTLRSPREPEHWIEAGEVPVLVGDNVKDYKTNKNRLKIVRQI